MMNCQFDRSGHDFEGQVTLSVTVGQSEYVIGVGHVFGRSSLLGNLNSFPLVTVCFNRSDLVSSDIIELRRQQVQDGC